MGSFLFNDTPSCDWHAAARIVRSVLVLFLIPCARFSTARSKRRAIHSTKAAFLGRSALRLQLCRPHRSLLIGAIKQPQRQQQLSFVIVGDSEAAPSS